ncbi:MAG: cobalt-precorrin-5B (C(1))-methyltransferase CbiD [Peptostreptococcaceae bacterium]|nr:cobalt-precorrin-5B (C(1))-methyltransferase CbiD [Peptostreptococcaceae bacterium]
MQQDEMVIVQGQKKLRRGYTTGTTATAAAKYAACLMAGSLGDIKIEKEYRDFAKEKEGEVFEYTAEIIPIRTVKGITVAVELKTYQLEEYTGGMIGAIATAIKESGDDPDVTHGAEISARVFFQQRDRFFRQDEDEKEHGASDPQKPLPQKYLYAIDRKDLSTEPLERDEAIGLDGNFGLIAIFGGEGVGFVTQKGLAPTKGHSAINPTPRQMIVYELTEVLRRSEQLREMLNDSVLCVEIIVKGGAEIAKKTFNEKLGILGGISILGTSGIVEPMSEKALVDTIRTELDQFRALDTGEPLLICPGNYGQAFAKESLRLDLEKSVKISNFIGEALDYMVVLSIDKALLVGHAGKLLKLGASVMNTHSAYADGRQEVMASHSAICGASRSTLIKIMEAISIEEMLDALLEEGQQVFDETMESIGKAMRKNIDHRTKEKIQIEFIVFTNSHGIVLQSSGAQELLARLQEEE